MEDRPFSILGVQQIAVGGLDKQALRRFWIDILGLTPAGSHRSEAENVDEDVALAGVGPRQVEVDLMQPIDPEKRPRVHEPALNHVGLWVDDLRRAVEWLGEQGVRFTPGEFARGAPVTMCASSIPRAAARRRSAGRAFWSSWCRLRPG